MPAEVRMQTVVSVHRRHEMGKACLPYQVLCNARCKATRGSLLHVPKYATWRWLVLAHGCVRTSARNVLTNWQC
jgi:hypothetical protein